jgi:8-oxo-dGTP pyrophosphatase MutT (NUDIX family)
MPVPEFIRELRSKVGHALLQLPTVAVLVRDESDRLLLVQDSDSGLWTCPGGLVEPFELPADAAVREAWEEAGVHVELTALIGVFGGEVCQTHYRNGDKVAWVANVFAARIIGGTAKADGDETTAIRYCTADELVTLPMQPWVRLFIDAAATAGTGYFQSARWQPDAPAAP